MGVQARTVLVTPACTACTASQSIAHCTAATKAWAGVVALRLRWSGHQLRCPHEVITIPTPALSALSCRKRETTPQGKNSPLPRNWSI